MQVYKYKIVIIYLFAVLIFSLGQTAFSITLKNDFSDSRQQHDVAQGLSENSASLRVFIDTANRYVDEGNKISTEGGFADALSYWRDVYKKEESVPKLQALALYQSALIQRELGQLSAARNNLRLAVKKLEKRQNAANLLAPILANLGSIELELGNYDLAKSVLEDSRVITVSIADPVLLADIITDLGVVAAAQKQFDKASRLFSESLQLAKFADSQTGIINAYSNLIRSAQANNNILGAVDVLKQAVAYLDAVKRLPTSYLSIVQMFDRLNYFPDEFSGELPNLVQVAVKELSDINSVSHAEPNNSTNSSEDPYLTSNVHGVMADLYFKSGLADDALVLAERAIVSAQQVGAKALLVRWLQLAGKIYRQKDNLQKAIQSYRLAIDNLRPIREQMQSTPSPWGDTYNYADKNIYVSLADLLLLQSEQIAVTEQRQSLYREARETVEQQKIAELQDYFQDTCVVSTANNIKNLDQVISDKSAILYPILLPNRLELLLSLSSGIQRFVVNMPADDIIREVNQFRINLEDLSSRRFLQQSKQLYTWLIQPLEKVLEKNKITNLVIVSEKVLRTIPFATLFDGKRYLVEKYALSVSPGLQLTDPRPINRTNLKVLLSGLSEPVQGFPALRYVQGELEEIQDLYTAKLLLNQEFITNSFEQAMQNSSYTIAHIASHSEFNGDVNDSYILTYDGRVSMDQLSRYTIVGRNREKPIELLTLSACQTAAGDDKAALGLAGVAVKSGARSALATLWAIDDFASSVLVSEFYRQLLNDKISKAQALQIAQQKLISTRRFDHPAYWSPFLLIGNWL